MELPKGSIRRIHLTGGPGSGKTKLARRVGSLMAWPVFEMDHMALDIVAEHGLDLDLIIAAELRAIGEAEARVSEGSYLGWAEPVLDDADLIIYLNPPAQSALFRILLRHAKAEKAGTNRFPGWLRLLRFWKWSQRYYANRNGDQLNPWGVPETRRFAEQTLARYDEKLVCCRSSRETDQLLTVLVRSQVPGALA